MEAMTEASRLDLEKSYAAILQAARAQRFISYGDLAAASGVPWSRGHRLIPQHLGQLVTLAHERGWPMPSAIVVNRENVDTGTLDGPAREGFLAAARDVGHKIIDPEQFVKDQQERVFAWAPSAPDTLGLANGDQKKLAGASGPQFIHYFTPLLDALRSLDGEAKPKDVCDWIVKNNLVSDSELKAVTKNGQSKFENRVAWARFYLTKAGLLDDRRRGVWALTPEGREAKLDHAQSLALYKDVHGRFQADDTEEEAAPPPASTVAELFDDPSRQFWFAGAAWEEGDQTERFLREGVWQNGYDEKFSDEVRKIRPGDRIAIKASFVQRHKLPFDVGGKSVSVMRIKAIGIVTENPGDGKTVRVDWQPLHRPREWFFYTYRTTLNEADPNDPLARQLILFTFGDARQDYQFWLNQPYFANKYAQAAKQATTIPLFDDDEEENEDASEENSPANYTLDQIIEEGCFLARPALDTILLRLREKKNIILQGPPGTGKTWLAKRLGYALIGTRDRKAIRQRFRVVQFHPSLSYEDFVRGWRPELGGGLALIDGIFLEIVHAASAEPDRPFVLIIEEINRGNPAQVFGEMLTLLEDSKRRPDEALELAYRRAEAERVYIPANLHVIGTMNIADRSLALVDLALRRRFAFISLEPALNERWRAWCTERCGFDSTFLSLVEERIHTLNKGIAADRSLGSQYRIGHSYITPADGVTITDHKAWFRNIVETEIAPLLEEYWFDAPEKATEAAKRLLADLS